MGEIGDFKDLVVWQKARELVRETYKITKLLPKDEMFSLTSQIRRAVISVMSNIAEGYGRHYLNEYVRFLKMARGSCYELESQLIICEDAGYVSNTELSLAYSLIKETEKLLASLLRSLES